MLAVVEPSLSGIHDLQRLLELCKHFKVTTAACINKADLNAANADAITAWCDKAGVPVVGALPYSDVFRAAVQAGKTVMEMGDASMEYKVQELWRNIAGLLGVPAENSAWNTIRRKIPLLSNKRS